MALAGNNPPGEQTVAYSALTQALRQALSRRDRWQGIRPIWLAEVGRLLPEMGDVFPDLPRPVEVEASQAQARLFEGINRCLLGLARQGPVLLCLDDVHWADAGTMGWLTALAPRLAESDVCILATYRSAQAGAVADVKRAYARRGLLAEVPLSRLTPAAVEGILEQLPDPPVEPQPLAKRIHHATGGNTFFVLETVRALMEGERLADPPDDLPLAPTVEAAIRRRLERLNPLGRQVLESAAVLGSGLRVDLLQETAGRSDLEVAEGLDEVVGRQLLVDGERRGFSHDLVRQVTYEEISPWRRRILHRRAAGALEKVHHAASISSYDAISGRIAAHYEQGSQPGKALAYYRRAAAAALRVFARAEAHDYTVKGLDMLEKVTDKSEYASQELELQLLLGAILLDTERLFDPQIEVAFGRAAELSELLHEPLKQARALQGLCYFNINRSGLDRGQTYAERLLVLGRTLDNKEILVDGHWNLGSIFQFKGQFTEARKHLKIASRHYRHEDLKNAKIYGQPAEMACLAYLAQTLQFLGYPNRALEQLHTATILAQQKAHPNYRGLALIFTAQVFQQRGNHAVTREAADELLSIIEEFRVPLFYAIGTLYRGWALFAQGEREEGLDQLGEAVRMVPQSPPIPATPMYLSLMVEAYTQAGQLKRAAGILDQAWAVVEKSGLHFWEAELRRLRAELRWQQGEPAATVEHSFLRAVQVAGQQHAKWLELRAVMSLARWWQSQGRREEARQKLAEIYEWFTEGFDTLYLKTAEALLEELA